VNFLASNNVAKPARRRFIINNNSNNNRNTVKVQGYCSAKKL